MTARVAYVEATEENMKEVEEEGQKEQKVSWSFWRFLLRRKQAIPGEFLCQCYNPCKAVLGKLPRDGVKHIWGFLSMQMPS